MPRARVEVDPQQVSARISPLLFGHNLEHTRSVFWRGLGAELLLNRKFALAPGPEGVSLHWERAGDRGAGWFLHEGIPGWKGTRGEPFTSHYDPRTRAGAGTLGVQMIQSFKTGGATSGGFGIGQGGIHLEKGRGYEARVALRAESDVAVTLRVCDRERRAVHHEETLRAGPGEWSEHRVAFAAPRADAEARFEVLLEGEGTLRVGAASLMPADHFHRMRRDVVERLKDIGVPILRWPGGNFAGAYVWKDGLLPVDRRAPTDASYVLPHTSGIDDHDVGVIEFLALCRELGAEPYLTINISLEGAAEAGQFVEFMNGSPDTEWGGARARLGHEEPFGVRFWSLGNEAGYDHMAGPRTPAAYADVARECAEAMRRADPSIELTASGLWWEEEWAEAILERAGDVIDHVSYHEYTQLIRDYAGAGGARADVIDVITDFRRLAASAAEVKASLERVRSLVDRHAQSRAPAGKRIGISFDEWNVWYAWFRDPGAAEGVHAAAMLNMLAREAGRLGITIGNYFEPVNEGAVRVGPGSARLTPAGEVFAIFKRHHGNALVPTAQPEGAVDVAASVDIAASRDEATGEVVVTLVNLSPDEDAVVELLVRETGARAAAAQAEVRGTLLAPTGITPGSDFERRRLEVDRRADGALALKLPPAAVAAVRIAAPPA